MRPLSASRASPRPAPRGASGSRTVPRRSSAVGERRGPARVAGGAGGGRGAGLGGGPWRGRTARAAIGRRGGRRRARAAPASVPPLAFCGSRPAASWSSSLARCGLGWANREPSVKSDSPSAGDNDGVWGEGGGNASGEGDPRELLPAFTPHDSTPATPVNVAPALLLADRPQLVQRDLRGRAAVRGRARPGGPGRLAGRDDGRRRIRGAGRRRSVRAAAAAGLLHPLRHRPQRRTGEPRPRAVPRLDLAPLQRGRPKLALRVGGQRDFGLRVGSEGRRCQSRRPRLRATWGSRGTPHQLVAVLDASKGVVAHLLDRAAVGVQREVVHLGRGLKRARACSVSASSTRIPAARAPATTAPSSPNRGRGLGRGGYARRQSQAPGVPRRGWRAGRLTWRAIRIWPGRAAAAVRAAKLTMVPK